MKYYLYTLISLSTLSCSGQKQVIASPEIIKPVIVTEPVNFDSDDPAIWVNPKDPSKSLIIGTDKDINGGLFVFNLEGKIQKDLSVTGLQRPNNVDIAYGLTLCILIQKETYMLLQAEKQAQRTAPIFGSICYQIPEKDL